MPIHRKVPLNPFAPQDKAIIETLTLQIARNPTFHVTESPYRIDTVIYARISQHGPYGSLVRYRPGDTHTPWQGV